MRLKKPAGKVKQDKQPTYFICRDCLYKCAHDKCLEHYVAIVIVTPDKCLSETHAWWEYETKET